MILETRLSKLKAIIRSAIYESWMSEDDFNEIEKLIPYQELSDDIDTGIANGHSEDYQFQLLKEAFSL